jgi:hypothetical protein
MDMGDYYLDAGGQIWLHSWIKVIIFWIGVDKFGLILGQGQLLLQHGWTNSVAFLDRGNRYLDKGGQI